MGEKRQVVITIGIMLIIVLVGVGYIFTLQNEDETISYEDSQVFSTLATPEGVAPYTDTDGNEVTLLEANNPVPIVIYSWASWCVTCGGGLQELNRLAQAYDTAEVRFLAVNRSESERRANQFLDTLPTLESIEIILDADDYLFESIEGYAVPETVVFGEDGSLLLQERGDLDIANINQVLN